MVSSLRILTKHCGSTLLAQHLRRPHDSRARRKAIFRRSSANDDSSTSRQPTPPPPQPSGSGQRHCCQICWREFASLAELSAHVWTHPVPFICDVCDKVFEKRSHWVTHRRLHAGERPFTCEFCSKTFTQMGNLNVHRRIHYADWPYPCDLCKRRFTQRSNLYRHQRRHQ